MKIVTLYYKHVSLLNVCNYYESAGILQEMNTFQLAFTHHNNGAMFAIAPQTGISQSLKSAGYKLKLVSVKELCYSKTYVKKYPTHYETAAGKVLEEII